MCRVGIFEICSEGYSSRQHVLAVYNTLYPTFIYSKTGVYLFFIFLIQNIDCWYSLEPPRQGGFNTVLTINVLSKNIRNITVLSYTHERFFSLTPLGHLGKCCMKTDFNYLPLNNVKSSQSHHENFCGHDWFDL